jgi:hypothetical protein
MRALAPLPSVSRCPSRRPVTALVRHAGVFLALAVALAACAPRRASNAPADTTANAAAPATTPSGAAFPAGEDQA